MQKNLVNAIKTAKKLANPSKDKNIFSLCDKGLFKTLNLESRIHRDKEAWYFKDKNDKLRVSVNVDKISSLAKLLENLALENMQLHLEKELAKCIPIDFADAMVVAKSYLDKSDCDPQKAVWSMKKEHPNLFVDLDALMGRKGAE